MARLPRHWAGFVAARAAAQRSGHSGRQRSAGQRACDTLLTGLVRASSCVSSPPQQGVAVSCLPGLAHHPCGLPGGALAAAALPRLWSPLWGEVLCLLCTNTCSIAALTSFITVCTGSAAPEASSTLSLPLLGSGSGGNVPHAQAPAAGAGSCSRCCKPQQRSSRTSAYLKVLRRAWRYAREASISSARPSQNHTVMGTIRAATTQ